MRLLVVTALPLLQSFVSWSPRGKSRRLYQSESSLSLGLSSSKNGVGGDHIQDDRRISTTSRRSSESQLGSLLSRKLCEGQSQTIEHSSPPSPLVWTRKGGMVVSLRSWRIRKNFPLFYFWRDFCWTFEAVAVLVATDITPFLCWGAAPFVYFFFIFFLLTAAAASFGISYLEETFFGCLSFARNFAFYMEELPPLPAAAAAADVVRCWSLPIALAAFFWVNKGISDDSMDTVCFLSFIQVSSFLPSKYFLLTVWSLPSFVLGDSRIRSSLRFSLYLELLSAIPLDSHPSLARSSVRELLIWKCASERAVRGWNRVRVEVARPLAESVVAPACRSLQPIFLTAFDCRRRKSLRATPLPSSKNEARHSQDCTDDKQSI